MFRKNIITAVLIFISSAIWALAPNTSATLYQHLQEVNARWQYVEPTAEMLQPVSFENDTRRIQAHLYQVEKLLRSKPTDGLTKAEKQKRLHLLEVLHGYADAAMFPKNYDFDHRIPYFIDAHNTACAVGYLIIADGHQELADMIRAKGNYQYLLDMNYPELTAWVATSGFTAEELALIQPGYPADTPFSSFEGGTGTNGVVHDILVDQNSGKVYIAGEFTEVDGTGGFNNVAMYTGSGWDNMNGGVAEPAHALAIYNDQLYVAGEFDSSTTGVYSAGIIRWKNNAWESVQAGMLAGDVYALQVFNNLLYLGGDFELPTGLIRGYLCAITDSGAVFLTESPYGPVYGMCIHNGKLIAGGDFNTTTLNDTVYNIGVLNDSLDSFDPIGDGIAMPVYAVASFNGALFAGGALADLPGKNTGFAYWDGSTWTDESYMIGTFDANDSINRITSFMADTGGLYLGGNFFCCNGVIGFYYGNNLAYYQTYSGGSSMGPLTSFNDQVNTLDLYNGEIMVGGRFDTINFSSLGGPPHLSTNLGGLALRDLDWNSIVPIAGSDLNIKMYPVPVHNSLTVEISGKKDMAGYHLQVFNLKGQLLKELVFDSPKVEITTTDLAAGHYLLQVTQGSQPVAQGKFVVE